MLKLFFSFSGRLNRARFWLVILFWLALRIGIPYLFYFYHAYPGQSLDINDVTVSPYLYETGEVFMVMTVISWISTVSASVRRLHDFGSSGWWVLLLLVPGIEFIFTLIIGLIGSQRGTNEYGVNPLGENNFYIPGANEEMRVKELKDLAALYEKGLLSAEEYQTAKNQILKG
ncbi:MAG TPA: DUF805 domain-containing protein [Candidatus Aphodousia gallistercoris]|nr:DUF805 domain-containing protein [Candidatus Aphodousia gallistercoris]